jgi:solute carrier family 8 (sodium/calcium exchanger)
MDWPNPVRLILYLMGLGWTFLGVAVISDIFMAGIEKITSSKKRVLNKETNRTVTVYVWNATVANLTLMALGSSAPEILLSVIEITTGKFMLGALGAGTIVGSAAFNLLIISAVCVCAIPEPDSIHQGSAGVHRDGFMLCRSVLMADVHLNGDFSRRYRDLGSSAHIAFLPHFGLCRLLGRSWSLQ